MTRDIPPPDMQEIIAQDVAEAFQHWIETYKTHPRELVSAVTHGLAKYASIVSKNPTKALESIAKIMLATDYAAHQREYFSLTLGAHDVQKPRIVLAPEPTE